MSVSVEGAAQPGGDTRMRSLDAVLRRHQYQPDALLEILHAAQAQQGFLSEEVLVHVARGLRLPLSRVYGVASFYHLFTLRPQGRHTCTVCMGTACYVKRSGDILAAVERQGGLSPGQTTGDGELSLSVARCVGTCGTAPVVLFDRELAGRQTAQGVLARLKSWTGP